MATEKLFCTPAQTWRHTKILHSPYWAEFSQRVAVCGLWLADGAGLVEWRAVRGDPSGDNVPTQRLRGQPANNGSTREVCFLVMCHPFMCASHYQNRCPPTAPNKAVWVCVHVCVFYISLYRSVTLFCQNWSGYNWESDSGWPELMEAQLFCLASKRGRRNGRKNECPPLFYLDSLYRSLQLYSSFPKPVIAAASIRFFQPSALQTFTFT